ncbi:MAG: T9SS type A sorting domain-containing protein [Bacteroidota bacterium]|nr:T9SS type A sorting domain-containing protein [Bacteroidota bacterium]
MKKLFLFLTTLGFTNTYAQTYLMDNFAGSNDTLTSIGWTQIGTTATNPILKSTPALVYPGYVASGMGAAANLITSGQDIYRDLTLAGGVNTGQVFLSFMANFSSAQTAGDYFLAFLPSSSTSNLHGRLFARLSSPGYYRVAMNRWTETPAYSADSFALNQTQLFVVRYVFNTTTSNTDDSVYLYVFNSGVPSSMPATPTSFCSNATSNMASPSIGRVSLRQGSASNAATVRIGGMRLATNWNDGPLPVTLSSFEGFASENGNKLSWTTSSEINNKGFEIEKSENAESFEKIGFVAGRGNSQKRIQYSFFDNQINGAKTFYRLKQIDMDGKSSYSQIITVGSDMIEISVSPNPFTNTISLQSNQLNRAITAEVIDITGKTKISIQGEVNEKVEIDTQHLSKGVYFIRIQDGETTQTKRIIKN